MLNFYPHKFQFVSKHQQNRHDHYQTKNQFSIPLLQTSTFSNHTSGHGNEVVQPFTVANNVYVF